MMYSSLVQNTTNGAKELCEKLNLKIPINYLSHSIKEIIEQYNLPSFYDYPLRTYITSGFIKLWKQNPSASDRIFLTTNINHCCIISLYFLFKYLSIRSINNLKSQSAYFISDHISSIPLFSAFC